MRLEDLDYQLPNEQIAQRPLERRDASRLLLLERSTGTWQDRRFAELPALLRGDELLVVNTARVIPARLFGRRKNSPTKTIASSVALESQGATQDSGGKVEVFLSRQVDVDVWEALVRPGRKMQIGQQVLFGDGELEGQVIARGEFGARTLRFLSHDQQSVTEHFTQLGHTPLPPYIHRDDDSADRERYQTVFARRPGAVAAPTAGLHFTPEILEQIRQRGAEICELTLDVGLGTFQPIHTEILEEHVIHAENYEIPTETASQIQAAKKAGRPILAIGTTVVRALEDAASRIASNEPYNASHLVPSGKAHAGIFILPGFRFRVVDALLTNFHLPRSTLLALVSAFAGRERMLAVYRHAVEAQYRFYSYGDCMLIR